MKRLFHEGNQLQCAFVAPIVLNPDGYFATCFLNLVSQGVCPRQIGKHTISAVNNVT